MIKKWTIYMDKETGQFYVRNTRENGYNPDPHKYLYVDSSESKEETQECLTKCLQLGYDGYVKWKSKKILSEEKNPNIRKNLRRIIKRMK